MASLADESLDFFSIEEDKDGKRKSSRESSARHRFLKSSSSSATEDYGSPNPITSSSEGGSLNNESRSLIKSPTKSKAHYPLTIFLCLVGLHNPHRFGRSLWSGLLICLFSLALLLQLVINFACLVIDSKHCRKARDRNGFNISGFNSSDTNSSDLSSYLKSILFVGSTWQYLSQLITYCVALWCLYKVLRVPDALHPSLARFLAPNKYWSLLNRQMVFFLLLDVLWLVLTAYMMYDVIHEQPNTTLDYVLVIVLSYMTIMMMVGLLANHAILLMFESLVFAVSGCIDQMKQQILDLQQQKLEKSITAVKDLSKIVRATSGVFGRWFLVQWISYAMVIVWNSPLIQANISLPLYPIWTKTSLVVLSIINHTLFIFPAIVAAMLDARCKEMIRNLNDLAAVDWPDGHALKERSQLELFLSFADRADIAFRAGPMPIRLSHALASVAFSYVLVAVNIALQNLSH
ncbi:uncharacterized protein LOC134192191 [Corticium candelabrum]|uniref:uncharacterized protein LOC134192191 n=1 Tax=Corticium candelabrum TaxID=121492 RepID=UPI002E275C27|nr:uncharacterized protein LOC134192191 [Corticium candelabrum]